MGPRPGACCTLERRQGEAHHVGAMAWIKVSAPWSGLQAGSRSSVQAELPPAKPRQAATEHRSQVLQEGMVTQIRPAWWL